MLAVQIRHSAFRIEARLQPKRKAHTRSGHLLVLFRIVDLLGKLRYVRFPVSCQAGCR